MFHQVILPSLMALVLSAATSRATPVEVSQNLAVRSNAGQLKCANAPGIVAGNMVTQADVLRGSDLPKSGLNDPWAKYLWCTVGTQTYIYFDFGPMQPPPSSYGYYNVYGALDQAKAAAGVNVAKDGGAAKLNPDGNNFPFNPQASNCNAQVFMHDSVGKMTWDIIYAALSGLATVAQNYNQGDYPMVYKINHGALGEVGSGYVGLYPNPKLEMWRNGDCLISVTPAGNQTCRDITNQKTGFLRTTGDNFVPGWG